MRPACTTRDPVPTQNKNNHKYTKMIESKRLYHIISKTQRILPSMTVPWTQLFLIGSLSLPDSLCHLEHFLFPLLSAHITVGHTTQHLLESGVEILLAAPRDQRQTSPRIIDCSQDQSRQPVQRVVVQACIKDLVRKRRYPPLAKS